MPVANPPDVADTPVSYDMDCLCPGRSLPFPDAAPPAPLNRRPCPIELGTVDAGAGGGGRRGSQDGYPSSRSDDMETRPNGDEVDVCRAVCAGAGAETGVERGDVEAVWRVCVCGLGFESVGDECAGDGDAGWDAVP